MDQLLIRQALTGDEAAVQRLVRRLSPVLEARARVALARGATRGVELSDLVQDVWYALLRGNGRALRDYDPTRGASLEGYVGMIAAREIGNRLRLRAAQKRGSMATHVDLEAGAEPPESGPTPEAEVAASELALKLGRHLMASLSPRGQLVFRYAFTDGMPPARVAEILQVDLQVIYNWQHKIRRVARDFLESQDASKPA